MSNILTDLHATFLIIMGVLIGYLLVTTVVTPVIGRLADIWGRKRLYNSGYMIFALGSLVADLAQPQFHGGDLIVGRIIQGVGGALMLTNSTAIVTDAFRKGQVGLGLGVNQIAGAAGFLIGPMIGGLFTEWSWRWVFLFNVPLAVAGAIWGAFRLREPVQPESRQRIDWIGSLTLTIGLTGTQGPYGKDPLMAGLLLAPFGAALLVIGPFSGLLSDRIGSRLLAPIGLGIAALGLLGLTTIGPSTPYWMLAAFMALVGGGSGFFVSFLLSVAAMLVAALRSSHR